MNMTLESIELYDRARKRGLRESAAAKSKGQSGFLAVLDAKREECGVLAFMAQPMRKISLNRIIGTYQASRANSFSPGFMPLLPANTEFAAKWINLCGAHLQEGIRDSIQVYEYLWKYYVAEGNKRVSILKYFDIASYEAEITRLIPQWDENNPDTERYYTFLAYVKKGVFQDIELSESKKYDRLYRLEQRLVAELGENDHPNFNALYITFEMAYLQTSCTMSLGDAFVEYLHIFGLPRDVLPSELAQRILTLKPQYELLEKPQDPRLVLENEVPDEKPLFAWLLSGHKNPKIVFAYGAGRTEGNWLGAHEKGRLAMQESFGDKVQSLCLDGLNRDNAYELLTENAADAGLLFVTSPSMMNPVLRFALENPSCVTMVYSRMQHHYRLHTYFGRYYEVMFVCGMAAALSSKTGVVGYITPQLAGQRFTSDINAFALGAHSVCPNGRVILMTRDVSPLELNTCEQARIQLAAMGADVVLTPLSESLTLPDMPRNVFSVLISIDRSGRPVRYLASPSWNWDRFYLAIVKSYLNGSLEALRGYEETASPIMSFWWGIGAGVLDLHIAPWAPPATSNLMRFLKGCIARNQFNPFHGPLIDSDGQLRVPAHTDPRPVDIMNMRYLVDFLETVE